MFFFLNAETFDRNESHQSVSGELSQSEKSLAPRPDSG
jgi:hypothetical protein